MAAISWINYTYHSWLVRFLHHQYCFSSEVMQAEANNGNVSDSYEDSYLGNWLSIYMRHKAENSVFTAGGMAAGRFDGGSTSWGLRIAVWSWWIIPEKPGPKHHPKAPLKHWRRMRMQQTPHVQMHQNGVGTQRFSVIPVMTASTGVPHLLISY